MILLLALGCNEDPSLRTLPRRQPDPVLPAGTGSTFPETTTTPEDTGLVADTGGPNIPGTGLLIPPPSIATESSWCFTIAPIGRELGIFVVGMDSGTIEEFGRYGQIGSSNIRTGGFAYNGRDELVISESRMGFYVVDLDLQTHTYTSSAAALDSVTFYDHQYLTYDINRQGHRYSTSADVVADNISDFVPETGWFTRSQVRGNLVFGAWHATDAIEVWDVATGQEEPTIFLEDYDTWVWGIGISGTYLHVLDDGREILPTWTPRLARFDMNGAAVNYVHLDGVNWDDEPKGLWCDGP
ncbi:MAG: hypothetical protein AAGA48_24400 [Myxococcota bacterium]